MTASAGPKPGDTLYGLRAIASFMHSTIDEVIPLVDAGAVPTFRHGKRLVCASKSELREWLDDYRTEAQRLSLAPKDGGEV
jgi:hypothetical protein